MTPPRSSPGTVIRKAHFPGRAPIDAYGNGGFRFAGMSHRGSILCLPSGIYGCTKVWAEALAHHYHDTTDMSMIGLRIGVVNAEDKPLQKRHRAIWCSQRDVARMVRSCVEAPDELKHDVFFVVSNNRYSYRDMNHAREVLGFEPQDSAEDR